MIKRKDNPNSLNLNLLNVNGDNRPSYKSDFNNHGSDKDVIKVFYQLRGISEVVLCYEGFFRVRRAILFSIKCIRKSLI